MERHAVDLFRYLLVFMFTAIMFSCSEPTTQEEFIKQSGRETDGSYRFEIDLSDSLRSNTLYLYALIDATEREFERMPSFILFRINAISPFGAIYTETVSIPIASFVKSTPYSRQYEALYRSDFVPVRLGQWTLSISVIEEENYDGFRGIGLKHIKGEKQWEKIN